jgi:hypothetical protein
MLRQLQKKLFASLGTRMGIGRGTPVRACEKLAPIIAGIKVRLA